MASVYSPATNSLLGMQNTPYTGVDPNAYGPPQDTTQLQTQPQQNNVSSYSVPKLRNLTDSIDRFGQNLGFGGGVESLSNSLTPEFASGLMGTTAAPATGFGSAVTSEFASGALPWASSTGGVGTGAGITGQFASGMAPAASNAGALTATPLSNVLGAAGIGYLGGGLIGGKTGSYLGAAGGAIGSAVAGSSLGMGIGAALGLSAQALNFALPGAGILIGGIAGKLFGNKKPSDKTMAGGINLADGSVDPYYAQTQSSTGKKFDGNNAKMRDSIQNGASQFSQYLLKNGATPKTNQQLVFTNGSRDGFNYFFRDPDKKTDTNVNMIKAGSDYNSFSNRLFNDIKSQYNIPPELEQKIKTLNSTNLTSLQNSGGLSYSAPSVGQPQGNSQGSQGQPSGVSQSSFQQFVANYKRTQNVNAA